MVVWQAGFSQCGGKTKGHNEASNSRDFENSLAYSQRAYARGNAALPRVQNPGPGVAGSEMQGGRVADDDVWRLAGFVRRLGSRGLAETAPGDAVAGKAVYEKDGCGACHRIGREGSDFGPALTDAGRRRGLAFLEESIIRPEAFVPNNYRAVQVVMKSGQTIAGIRLNEDDLSIQLRDTGGDLRSFLKENIREVRRDKPSLMPSYESRLSKPELANLVAFLNSLKGAQ